MLFPSPLLNVIHQHGISMLQYIHYFLHAMFTYECTVSLMGQTCHRHEDLSAGDQEDRPTLIANVAKKCHLHAAVTVTEGRRLFSVFLLFEIITNKPEQGPRLFLHTSLLLT